MSAMAWGKALRLHQWVKNVFVLAPVVFSKHLTNLSALDEALGVMLAFCLASSAVYVVKALAVAVEVLAARIRG